MRNGSTVRRATLWRLLALIAVFGLLATACGEAEEEPAAEDPGAEEPADDPAAEDDGAEDEAEDTTEEDTAAPEDAEPIEMGWIAWDENIANTFLWKEILEREGYEVNETQLDAGPVFTGIAQGDLDVFLDAWFPLTHEDYREQYGDDMEDLGVWYDGAVLTIAVPDYVEVQSLAELADYGDTFDNEIVGIEPGAGLTRITNEEVMPGYGLDDWTLLESSTPAMLAELETAINDEEPIVVTLWRPHWAYAEYDIRDLEDPEGHLGEAEQIHVVARTGFSEEYPQVAGWLENYEMSDDELGSLSALINEMGEGSEQEAAAQWIEENGDVVDSWLGR